ncbi:Jwa [Drosophila busckii]|uniref:PRA1 family protein n=2 Tax=Drosophila busckii TaxID=30019 RepID=A0A0M5IWS6_DROBS|nr:Jwa [Drosophila busckii]
MASQLLAKDYKRGQGQFNYQKLSQTLTKPNKYSKMSAPSTSAASDAAAALAGSLQLPPLRTLDDFVLGSARFQLPNLKDFDKWGNRVVKNLLYYQTNYFLVFLAVYVLMIVINPTKIISGLIVQALIIAVIWQFFSSKSKKNFIASRLTGGNAVLSAQSEQQKWYILAGALLAGYLFLHMISAVLLTAFTLLLPISMTFIHASLRLRNIKNKLANTIESFGPSTPMGALLDALNVRADGVIN